MQFTETLPLKELGLLSDAVHQSGTCKSGESCVLLEEIGLMKWI